MELHGSRLVDRAVATARQAGCAPLLVVVGAAADEVATGLPADVAVVRNPDWPTGMGSSFRAALEALPPGVGAAVILLVDQPLVSAAAVRRLAAAWREGAQVAVATYGGRRRNPVLFDRATWPDARRAATGDEGARSLLRDRPDLVTEVPCDDVADPRDIDTPEDLARLRATRPRPT